MPGGCWTAADGSCPSGLKRGAPEACTSFHPTRSRRAIPDPGENRFFGADATSEANIQSRLIYFFLDE